MNLLSGNFLDGNFLDEDGDHDPINEYILLVDGNTATKKLEKVNQVRGELRRLAGVVLGS